jgi:hypothetical protein
MKDERNLRISFAKAGNGISARLVVPVPWLRKMGVNQEEREVKVVFDEETQMITICKKK